MLVYALSEESKGWVYFSGKFKDADAFLGTSDGRLLLADGTQLYTYANGTDGATSYADAGAAILMKWWTPWLRPKAGRWANIGYEIVMEDVAETSLVIYRAVDERDDTGRLVAEATLTEGTAYWDEVYWDEAYWDAVRRRIVVRDKFLADSFWLTVQNNTTAGPISVIGIKPIGK